MKKLIGLILASSMLGAPVFAQTADQDQRAAQIAQQLQAIDTIKNSVDQLQKEIDKARPACEKKYEGKSKFFMGSSLAAFGLLVVRVFSVGSSEYTPAQIAQIVALLVVGTYGQVAISSQYSDMAYSCDDIPNLQKQIDAAYKNIALHNQTILELSGK